MEAMPPEKSRSLHNFSLPRLSWGAQRLLRCSNADSAAEKASADIHYSRRPRPHHSHDTSRSGRDPAGRRPLNGSTGSRDGERIEVMREKIMIDLKSEVDKIKNAILVEGGDGDQSAVATEDPRPSNLRTRMAACQEPIAESEAKPRFTPRRKKFSITLSRREVEEDLVQLSRRRPARKPKKRPRDIQKELNMLFPGYWLSEITADMYKVEETVEPLQGE